MSTIRIDPVNLCKLYPWACNPPPQGPRGPLGPPIHPRPDDVLVPIPEAVHVFAASLPPDTKFLTAQQWKAFGDVLTQEGLYSDAMMAGEFAVLSASGGELQTQVQGMQLQARALLQLGENEAAQIAFDRVQHIQEVARLTEELQQRFNRDTGL